MRSTAKKVFYYQADANALGGFFEQPFHETVPGQATSSLATVGGSSAAHSGPFYLEDLVSFRAAHTRVSGRALGLDGPWSVTATAVVEGLKILKRFEVERLVTKVSVEFPVLVEHPQVPQYPKIVLAGSVFDGLTIDGRKASISLSPTLASGQKTALSFPDFQREGQVQAKKLLGQVSDAEESRVKNKNASEDYKWLAERFGWMETFQPTTASPCVLSSLVDGVANTPGSTFGHAIVLPDFGSVFLSEVLVCPTSVQVTSLRAELGCKSSGKISAGAANVRGGTYPP